MFAVNLTFSRRKYFLRVLYPKLFGAEAEASSLTGFARNCDPFHGENAESARATRNEEAWPLRKHASKIAYEVLLTFLARTDDTLSSILPEALSRKVRLYVVSKAPALNSMVFVLTFFKS
jgi:hypothetical protein